MIDTLNVEKCPFAQCLPQQRLIGLARDFHSPKRGKVWRDELGVKQGETGLNQMIHQIGQRNL